MGTTFSFYIGGESEDEDYIEEEEEKESKDYIEKEEVDEQEKEEVDEQEKEEVDEQEKEDDKQEREKENVFTKLRGFQEMAKERSCDLKIQELEGGNISVSMSNEWKEQPYGCTHWEPRSTSFSVEIENNMDDEQSRYVFHEIKTFLINAHY